MKSTLLLVSVLPVVLAMSLTIKACPSLHVTALREGETPVCVTLGCGLSRDFVTSNMVLSLSPGEYVLDSFSIIQDLTNFSLIGEGLSHEVSITCTESVGFAFVNISGLILQNLTVRGCGLNGAKWTPILAALGTFLEDLTFIQIPPPLKTSVFVGASDNVLIENVAILATSGIGLVGVNIMGDSQMKGLTFSDNWPVSCSNIRETDPLLNPTAFSTTSHELIGGGAYFLYQDFSSAHFKYNGQRHKLSIVDGEFKNNSDCSVTYLLELFARLSVSLQNLGYSIGGGGGLTLFASQMRFSINVAVHSVSFTENIGRVGAGLHVGLFSGVTNTLMSFVNCTFKGNGNTGKDSRGLYGGGFVIFIDLYRTAEATGSFQFPAITEKNTTIYFIDTTVCDNKASTGGGGVIISTFSDKTAMVKDAPKVVFIRCLFVKNEALEGSALLAAETKYSGLTNGLEVVLSNTTVQYNRIDSFAETASRGSLRYAGTIQTQSISLVLEGENTLQNNSGSGIYTIRSRVSISGKAVFAHNQGTYGGAMILIDLSFLILRQNSSTNFVSNTAAVSGGAIYVQLVVDTYIYRSIDCFLGFGEFDPLCFNNDACSLKKRLLGIELNFINNLAHVSGSMIFGATLENCTWATAIRAEPSYRGEQSLLENLHRLYTSVFHFDIPPKGAAQISTLSERFTLNDSTMSVMPGQTTHLQLTALDTLSQIVLDGLASTITATDETASDAVATLGQSGYWFTQNVDSSSNVPLSINGIQNQSFRVVIFSLDSTASTSVSINLLSCLPGFTYINSSCVCDSRLEAAGIQCDIDRQLLIVPHQMWLGPIGPIAGSGVSNDQLIVRSCVVDFCSLGSKEVHPSDFTTQCYPGSNRAGVLCGSCREGYSATLGSNQCIQCTNIYLLLLLVFLVVGLLLCAGMAFLHITISEGYLNGVLFYSNIVNLFAGDFVPAGIQKIAFIPTAFLSMNLGLRSCFFDGMNTLHIYALQLSFVAYLFGIFVVFTVLSRRIKFPGTEKYSTTKVFVTLFLLCYVSILQFCIGIISFVVLNTLGGETYLHWYPDPSIAYFQGLHAALSVLAILLILIYVLPLPLLCLFPQMLYKVRFLKNFKPFYDAIWAPFELQKRFWLGLRLMFRWVIFFLAYFVPFPDRIFAFAIFLILILFVQMKIKPLHGQLKTLIDECLVALALLMATVTLYLAEFEYSSVKATVNSVITVLAYFLFCVVLCKHILLRYPQLGSFFVNIWDKLRNCRRMKEQHENAATIAAPDHVPPEIVISTSDSDNKFVRVWQTDRSLDSTTSSSANIPRVVSFTELREPLLEEGEAEVTTIATVVLNKDSQM